MARETLTQRIALDGGDEIRKELAALGPEGEKAFAQLKAAADKAGDGFDTRITVALDRIRKGFEQVVAKAKDIGGALKDVGTAFEKLEKATVRTVKSVGLLVTAVTGAAAGFVAFVKSGTDAADAAGKQAQALGLTAQQFGGFAFAAKQGNIEQEKFVQSFTAFNKVIRDAAEGSKGAVSTFTSLGIRLRDTSGRLKSNAQLFEEVANAISKLPDGARKSDLALQLFGRSGAQLIPILNGGAAGIRELANEAKKLGVIFTDDQIATAEKMNDAFGRLGASVKAAKDQFALLFAPALTKAADTFTKAIQNNQATLLQLGQTIADRITPIVEDFANALVGNDKLVRTPWVLEWRDAVVRFAEGVRSAFGDVIIPAFNAFRAILETVAKAVNGVFGTSLSGDALGVILLVGKVTGAFRLLGAALVLVRSLAILMWTSLGGPATLAIVAGIIGVTAAVALLSDSQTDAEKAAAAHKKALDELDIARKRMQDGLPGAEAEFKNLAQANLDAAKAALEHAKAQVELRKQTLAAVEEANKASAVGPAENLLGPQSDISNARKELDDALAGLEQSQKNLAEIQQRIDGNVKGGVDAVTEGAKAAAGAVAGVKAELTATTTSAAGLQQAIGAAGNGGVVSMERLGNAVRVIRGGTQGLTQEIVNLTQQGVNPLFAATEKGTVRVFDAARGVITTFTGVRDAIKQSSDDAAQGLTEVAGGTEKFTNSLEGVEGVAARVIDPLTGKFTDISTAAGTASDSVIRIGDAAQQAGQGIDHISEATKSVAATVNDSLGGLREVTTQVGQGITQTGDAIRQVAESVAQSFQQIRDSAQGISFDAVAQALNGLPELAKTAADGVIAAFTGVSDRIRESMQAIPNAARDAFAQAVQNIREQLSSLVGSVNGLVSQMVSALNRLNSAIASAKAQLAQAQSAASAAGHAQGGRITGPGTSTSDSILARLSRGEWVIKARAVQKYGSDFFAALNSMRLPRNIAASLRHSLGHIQPRAVAVPAFAHGGSVDSVLRDSASSGLMRPLTLQIGNEVFSGLMTPEDTATRLTQFATHQRARQAGRKPNWYGGR